MLLSDVVNSIPGFNSWSHSDKIKLFAWYIHSYRNRERFNQEDIRNCYDELHLEKPSNVSPYLAALQDRKPKSVLKDTKGYYLSKPVRDDLANRYGQRQAYVQVDKILQDLPKNVPDLNQRTYLDEALICFKSGAFRAAIVMCWNLCYDHLCDYVLSGHLTAFNIQLPKSYPKAKISTISVIDDFGELKEFEILLVCKSANIISGNVYKILSEKLTRRNLAAHPTNIVFTQVQAEDFIIDLINNVVLKLV